LIFPEAKTYHKGRHRTEDHTVGVQRNGGENGSFVSQNAVKPSQEEPQLFGVAPAPVGMNTYHAASLNWLSGNSLLAYHVLSEKRKWPLGTHIDSNVSFFPRRQNTAIFIYNLQ